MYDEQSFYSYGTDKVSLYLIASLMYVFMISVTMFLVLELLHIFILYEMCFCTAKVSWNKRRLEN